jgi:hypothetical protein
MSLLSQKLGVSEQQQHQIQQINKRTHTSLPSRLYSVCPCRTKKMVNCNGSSGRSKVEPAVSISTNLTVSTLQWEQYALKPETVKTERPKTLQSAGQEMVCDFIQSIITTPVQYLCASVWVYSFKVCPPQRSERPLQKVL